MIWCIIHDLMHYSWCDVLFMIWCIIHDDALFMMWCIIHDLMRYSWRCITHDTSAARTRPLTLYPHLLIPTTHALPNAECCSDRTGPNGAKAGNIHAHQAPRCQVDASVGRPAPSPPDGYEDDYVSVEALALICGMSHKGQWPVWSGCARVVSHARGRG